MEAGVSEEEVGGIQSPRIRFFPVVHFARFFLKNIQQKVIAAWARKTFLAKL